MNIFQTLYDDFLIYKSHVQLDLNFEWEPFEVSATTLHSTFTLNGIDTNNLAYADEANHGFVPFDN